MSFDATRPYVPRTELDNAAVPLNYLKEDKKYGQQVLGIVALDFEARWNDELNIRRETGTTPDEKMTAARFYEKGKALAREEIEIVLKEYSLPEDDLEWAVSRTTLERVEIFMVSRAKKDWAAKTMLKRAAATDVKGK